MSHFSIGQTVRINSQRELWAIVDIRRGYANLERNGAGQTVSLDHLTTVDSGDMVGGYYSPKKNEKPIGQIADDCQAYLDWFANQHIPEYAIEHPEDRDRLIDLYNALCEAYYALNVYRQDYTRERIKRS